MSETNIHDPELKKLTLQQVIRQRIIGVHPDDLETRLDDDDWERVVAALDRSDWIEGYWAACSLFAGNREEHDRLRDAFLESRK
jgi:hypothetical protein